MAPALVAGALTGCLATPGDVTQIELVSTTTDGWRYQYFRNRAYGCAISGYQTFLIGTKVGSTPPRPGPLWVKMHGGGVGYFDATGTPSRRSNKTEEPRASLINTDRQRADGRRDRRARGVPLRRRVDVQPRRLRRAPTRSTPTTPTRCPTARPHHQRAARHQGRHPVHRRAAYPTDDVFLHGGSAGSAGVVPRRLGAWSSRASRRRGSSPTRRSSTTTWELAQIDQGLPCAIDPAAGSAHHSAAGTRPSPTRRTSPTSSWPTGA